MNSNHTLTIQARVKLDEKKVIDNYAKMNNISISDLIRNTLLEKIEDEIDLDIYKKEMARYKKNPKTYSKTDIEKELDL